MNRSIENVQRAVNELYKSHYGKIVTSLLRVIRGVNLETIEDLVQDSFASAIVIWEKEGLPANPAGWIFFVCKNKALNKIKEGKRIRGLYENEDFNSVEPKFSESAFDDQQLRLLFACAHPDLSPKVQVVITLKYVANLKVEAIAKVLGMTIDGIDKLLLRARQKIREEKILLEEPGLPDLKNRLPIVHKILYLVYNEGYKSSWGKEMLREELCQEALLMIKALLDSKLGDTDTAALYALMLFNSARFKTRFGPSGELMDLEAQDRALWNKNLILLGCDFLKESAGEIISTYHYEAAIAYLHCSAKNFKATEWGSISNLYLKILHINPNPFVELNYAIALYYAGEKQTALEILNKLKQNPFLNQYYLLNATLGKVYLLEGEYAMAKQFFIKALRETDIQVEKDYIQKLMAQKEIPKYQYPQTKMEDQQDIFFGTAVKDPYRWLEDDGSDSTVQWLKEENKVTEDYLSKIPFRNIIKERLTKVWNFEKYSAPFKEGEYIYFYKNDGLQNQSVLYRQKEGLPAEVFLDPNKFSADGTTALAGIKFTRDGSLCAYLISEGGSDWNKIVVLNSATKTQVGDTLENVKFSGIAWLHNDGFYYSSYDSPKEGSQLSGKTDHHKLYYHRLNAAQSTDTMIFGGEKMPRRYIGAYVTEDQEYLVVSAANATYGNELYIKDLTKKETPFSPVVTGFETEQEVLYSANNKLYILTNMQAPNRKIVITDAAAPTAEHWKDLIPETSFPLTASTGGDKIFAQYIKDAVSQVYQFSLEGKQEKLIEFPGIGTAVGFNAKKEEKEVFYTFSSYIYPPTIFKYAIATAKSEVFKKAAIPFDLSQYESSQVFYSSKDGTRIPMSITHKKGLQLNGNNPTILYGYGGFNVSLTPAFTIPGLVFMENGGVYAVPNIRGGGEYGDNWHKAGTKLNKQNVFDDFIAAAEFLIKGNITSSQYLAISGGSNGGLLVGACMTQRPELFRVALPAVGVMDMLRYNKFTAGAGWAYDYGTADDNAEMFHYLFKYSPVHSVKPNVCYPSTMITTGDHDDRVVPAHSFKFAAALQAAQSCNNPVLIRIETRGGHGAGKPTGMIIDELTDRYAFLFNEMGLTFKDPDASTVSL